MTLAMLCLSIQTAPTTLSAEASSCFSPDDVSSNVLSTVSRSNF